MLLYVPLLIKSLAVVRKFIENEYLYVTTSTIHSFLRIKEKITEKGRVFVPDYSASPPTYCDYIIIDECSMLSNDLLSYIINSGGYYGNLLFVGDSAQLPPVDDNDEEYEDCIPPVFKLHIKHKASFN